MRNHHKHSSTESQRESLSTNSSDVPNHHEQQIVELKRSNSTPSLKRCWLCQSCKVLNNSVTWHCLSCECVSLVAPIYKDTLQKGCIRPEQTATKDTNLNNHTRCKSKQNISNSVSCNKLQTGAMNQQQQQQQPPQPQQQQQQYQSPLSEFDRLNHRYSNRPMDLCPVLMAATNSTGDCYVKQVKYNEVTRYRSVGGLCPLNRHHENKSLPNIVDAFMETNVMRPKQEISDNFFGERIFTVNKPNAFTMSATAIKTATANHGINSARKALTPMHEIHKFTRFATKSAARESVVKKMCTPGEACRMCNLGRCQNDAFVTTNHKNPTENPLDTSRFTITTLSRNNAIRSTDKNQTLTRNGGVLIAVRDWSMEKTVTPNKNGVPTSTPMSPDSYYEILRNPNNNAATDVNKENNRISKSQTHIYENSVTPTAKPDANGPIYAVVNKMNKTKNTKLQSAQSLRSPDQTKFTYIGMSPTSNVKSSKSTMVVESDALYATAKSSSQHNNNLSNNNSNNNNGVLTNMMPSLNNNVNNNNGLPMSECTPTSTNVEFSTKVWKGNKKPIESTKK